mmetsp:Transcript_321/g.905  ORF Transcript_321/g.905 Transcript_321/m.905 type:complete len:154 (-) Transcript_321:382-843(-)
MSNFTLIGVGGRINEWFCFTSPRPTMAPEGQSEQISGYTAAPLWCRSLLPPAFPSTFAPDSMCTRYKVYECIQTGRLDAIAIEQGKCRHQDEVAPSQPSLSILAKYSALSESETSSRVLAPHPSLISSSIFDSIPSIFASASALHSFSINVSR